MTTSKLDDSGSESPNNEDTPGLALPHLYEQQLSRKVEKTKQELAGFGVSEFKVYPSTPSHYRMRAEFKIWHQDGRVNYAMYQAGRYKKPVIIEKFSIGSEQICSLMPLILEAINQSHVLKRKLFQIEFLTSSTGEALITLIYHRPLEASWQAKAEILGRELGCAVIGRSRKQKMVLSKDFIMETFEVSGKRYEYQQVEASFTQPNAFICQKMLNWAQTTSQNIGGDLLELYCGNANFTLPLSKNFDKVLATEVSKTSVKSAEFNISKNKCDNIVMLRMSSEEFTNALNRTRSFRRLEGINLNEYTFSTVFVDPPRAGLDEGTLEMIRAFDNILYVSCNPETLATNLRALSDSYDVVDAALFDQFPYTDHRECGVRLKRK